MNNTSLIINSSKELIGDIMIPGDKSITHRAIILGSLCSGKVIISNGLFSEDCLKTIYQHNIQQDCVLVLVNFYYHL